jgi:hypothetical protein
MTTFRLVTLVPVLTLLFFSKLRGAGMGSPLAVLMGRVDAAPLPPRPQFQPEISTHGQARTGT